MLLPRWITVVLVMLGTCGPASAEDATLIQFAFDEGTGRVARDASGNGLHGVVSAGWVDSPAGKALSFDGKSGGIVKFQVPLEKRLGKGSWTFSAWLKPTQFHIDDRQNQRRIFSFGTFPDANLVIDLMGDGRPSWYFCYKNRDGKIISAGGTAATALTRGNWAFLALVCDREGGEVELFVDGRGQGTMELPAGFDGDFSLGGELTLGGDWHNYWGLMDEVRVDRRARPRGEIREEFARLKGRFGVTESAQAIAAGKREEFLEALGRTQSAWAAGDFAAVRSVCAEVVASADAPAALRSYAHVRIAQSHAAEGKPHLARAEYARIAATAAYPEVHRAEARERMAELDRQAQGLPARDPSAARTSVARIDHFAAEVFVSPRGDDASDGSPNRPVASLIRARDLVRAIRARKVDGPVAVSVLPGEYRVTAPLLLSSHDSGTERGPVVYRALEPGKAVFYGGARLSGFQPVRDHEVLARLPEEARGKVVRCDLRALGINDYGQLAVRGYGHMSPPPTLELFVDGKPMTLARWPNAGFVGIRRLIEPGLRRAGQPSVFEYVDDRHARWTRADDAWLFGYFRYLWADSTIKVARIDPAARTVTTAEAYQSGMNTEQGIQYYAFNLLEELDRPGEWYLDRKAGVLYVYPPADLSRVPVEVGLFSSPMVVMDRVSDVRLEGLTCDLARSNGLELKDCRRCLIAGCTVRRMAGNGISILGGEADGLLGCDIDTIGRRATEVIGGNRADLTPGRHFVENCRIHDFGRIDRTYTPAIQLEGVGNRVAHNLLYDGPSSVMRIEGNDHLIEFNEVYNAVRESDDQGAMELFGNPTYRGVIFRYNRFTNCGKTDLGAEVAGQAAIRLDDAISGMVIYGNIFIRSANGYFGAVQMNSGRDNVIDNNLFIDCKQGVSGGWNPGNAVWRWVATKRSPADFFMNDLFLKRYPEMATMTTSPGINHLWRNIFYRCGSLTTGDRGRLDMVQNGVFTDHDPGFSDAAQGDYRLRPDATAVAALGFRPVPMDEIGLYPDAYRATWPVTTTPVPVPDWRTTRKPKN